jgi:PqqD family protein of HPr-rel-A system
MEQQLPGEPRTLRLAAEVTWRDLGDEVVLLDTASSTYYSLNASGGELLRRLEQGGGTEADLVRFLVETYGVEKDLAAADVRAFVQGLESQSLLAEA